MYRKYFKRIFDFSLALIAFTAFSPLIAIVTIWLIVSNHEFKPFFIQQRPGKNGKIFNVIKFKSMTDMHDSSGKLLPDEDRLTSIGKFIRKTSIDELPQFINVIKGDMSIVGPRPLLKQYLPLYTKEQARRHEVLPGITGWAQCHGRNDISWEEKFAHDVWYVDHCSFLIDLKIILLTFSNVIRHKGISHKNSATMPLFSGTCTPTSEWYKSND